MKSERLDEAKDAVNKLHALEMELAQTKAAREKEADCLAALEQSKTKVRKDLIARPRFPLFCARSNVPPPSASWCFVPHDAASHFSGLASSAISSLFVHYSKLTSITCPVLALLFPTTQLHTHTHTHTHT